MHFLLSLCGYFCFCFYFLALNVGILGVESTISLSLNISQRFFHDKDNVTANATVTGSDECNQQCSCDLIRMF
jgi:hypothetical protein